VLRVEPGRWLSVAVIVLSSTVLGFCMVYRFGGGLDAPAHALLQGTQIGLGVGLVAGAIALLVFAVNDSRRIAVARRLPHALVVQAVKDRPLVQALTRLQPGLGVPGTSVSVAFDTEGVSFWAGSRNPVRILFIPARDVLDVALGEPLQPDSTRGKTEARMKVVVQAQPDPVEVQFVLPRVQGFGTGFENLKQAQVAATVVEANHRRGGTVSRGTRESHFAFADDRVPGVTAWSVLRGIRMYIGVFLALLMISLVGVVALIAADVAAALVVGAFVVSVAVSYAPVWILRRVLERARRRERAAGYTTLNGLDLDLRQLHPRTGRALRQAGAPQLSADEFRRELSMA
jgi:hypothetical protein